MIRAAVDCRSAYPALVVVDDDAPAHVLFAGSLELGVLVPIPGKTLGLPGSATREITPEHVTACVEKILSAAVLAERMVIFGEVPRSPEFAGVLRERAIHDGVSVPLSPELSPQKLSAEAIGRHLTQWPDGKSDRADGWRIGGTAGTRAACKILLTDMGIVEAKAKGVSPRALKERGVAVGELSPTEDAQKSTESLDPAPGDGPDAPRAPLEIGDRVMGVDTGANVGVVVAELVGPGTWRQLFRMTVAVDTSGAEVRRDFAEGIAARMAQFHVNRVVIERVTHVHGGHVDAEAGASAVHALRAMATALVSANWLGGMVEALCIASPVEIGVNTAPAAQWRRRVVGGKRVPGDDQVIEVLRKHYPAWPAESTTHERDAAGLILWDALDSAPQPAKAPRKARAQGAGGPRKASRAKAGCTCPPHKGAHLRGCPARVARSSGGAQKCKICGAPRKGHVCAEKKIEKSTSGA